MIALIARRPHKYGAKATVVDGIRFASQREARRYGELKLLERAGKIRDLRLQPKFPCAVNGKRICEYRADFSYIEPHWSEGEHTVYEDSKGYRTKEYRIKKLLVEALYGITITEV